MSEHPTDLFSGTISRVEAIIYVPGAIVHDAPPAFKEFCEWLPEKPDAPLYLQCPSLLRFAASDDYPDPDEVCEALRGCHGFLVQGATPFFAEGRTSYSWGHYLTAWLYAASEADIGTVVSEWAAGTRASITA